MKNILGAIMVVLTITTFSFAQSPCRIVRNNCNVCNNKNIIHHNNFVDKFDNIVVPIQVTRIVEVPNLDLIESIVLIRDSNGKVVDARRQFVYDISNAKRQQVIIQVQENVFHGDVQHAFQFRH